MKAARIKNLLAREPFRPFSIRLKNGATYNFRKPREVGGPRNGRMIFYFGQHEAVRIDADEIAEIFATTERDGRSD